MSTQAPHGEMPPMGYEAQRVPAKEPARNASRNRVLPEPHETYEIAPDELMEGMDHFWMPTRISGQPNPDIRDFYEAGWEPAAAKDFPRQSGYGREYPASMIAAGLLENVGPNDAVIRKDLMLVVRPKHLSQRAEQATKARAVDQVRNQYARLQQSYRGRDGGSGIKTSYGRLPGMAPASDEE